MSVKLTEDFQSVITLNPDEPMMLDITGAKHVEVAIRQDKAVLWVNVDGVCRLRICRIKEKIHIEEQ